MMLIASDVYTIWTVKFEALSGERVTLEGFVDMVYRNRKQKARGSTQRLPGCCLPLCECTATKGWLKEMRES